MTTTPPPSLTAPPGDEPREDRADHPVAVGDVVALGLGANPAGDITCPVGQVTAVGPHGVKLALYAWVIGMFDQEILIRWDRIMEVRWAYRDAEGVFVMDPLAEFQTAWTRGMAYLRESAAARRDEWPPPVRLDDDEEDDRHG